MQVMERSLQRVLDVHLLSCGVIIDAAGEVVVRVGEFAAFCSKGLVSSLLGPYGSAKDTFDLVQSPDQIKPMMWAQGDEFAFLISAGSFVIVLFGREVTRESSTDYRDWLARPSPRSSTVSPNEAMHWSQLRCLVMVRWFLGPVIAVVIRPPTSPLLA
jgi:hypothetical protein